MTISDNLNRTVDEMLAAVHASDEEVTRVLAGASDGADLVVLVQQVNTQAKLAGMARAQLVV